MFRYVVCGLTVASEFTLAGIQEADEEDFPTPDVLIRRGAVPATLDDARHHGLNWQVAASAFLFRVPGVVRYLVTAGREIVVDVAATKSVADAAPFVLGTGFAALLHQRGSLVLHAAAVSFEGQAVALCGASGSGKSTLAAALCEAGCRFVSDDVSAILFDARGQPLVLPDGRQHRLWADTVERLSLVERQGPAIRVSIGKYHVDPASDEPPVPLPLATVVALRRAIPPHQPGMEPLKPADAAPLLRKDVYRPAMAAHLGRDPGLFGQIAALLGHVRAYRLNRPADFGDLDETVRTILAHLRAEH